MAKTVKPGQPAPISAQYVTIGPRGGNTGKEVQSTKGRPMPPTPKPGMTYKPIDPVKNGNGRP